MHAIDQLYRRPGALTSSWGDAASSQARAALATIASWLRNRSERRLLVRLDDRMLQDLGLSRGDVDREYDRPFWQPVDHAALDMARRNSGPRLGAMRRT
jgi:uncharacterized protein YjiS (DUF1127 family)